MNMFDELKKKSDLPANLALEDNCSYAVLVSDIEEVLGKATCENCKFVQCSVKEAYFGKHLECISFKRCNEWESKEVKNGTLQ